jgi:hypothetical protein
MWLMYANWCLGSLNCFVLAGIANSELGGKERRAESSERTSTYWFLCVRSSVCM